MSDSNLRLVPLEQGYISVDVDPGGGSVTSTDLKEHCPSCDTPDCYLDCDGSKAAFKAEEGDSIAKEATDECFERYIFNSRIDALESFTLAFACAGGDVTSDAFIEAITAAIDACGQNADLPTEIAAELGGESVEPTKD